MSKILAVADVHIHAYLNRNPGSDTEFRLHQGSRTVAQNIIQVGQQEGCDYIVFAGDVIEKSVNRPRVLSEVKYFLDTVMSAFKGGWIIWGNHDQDNKSSDQDISDSCLGVMLPPNLVYAHRSTVQIGNTLIGFNNWQPTFDLSWIKNKVDVLFTHATICYSDDELFESQELDESKFDLAICGDIHRMGQRGKYVSIGIPQRCKMGDSPDSSAVILDCENKMWKWVNLNPQDNLMRFEYTPVLENEGWCEADHTWYVYKQDTSEFIGKSGNIKVEAWEEIEALVIDAIQKSSLQAVHSEVLKCIKNIDSGEVDFNFTLLKFHCENWRSIDDITIDFHDGDRFLINGANGAGKSSLLSAIKYAFVDVSDTAGLTSLKPYIQFGTKDCLTEVEFLYQENVYKLRRGTKEYGLWVNGEPQKYSEKRMFEKDVRDRFPFISYLDAFFFDSEHHRFIGGMSPERKTEIVSKFLKLDRIDTYNETARIMGDQFRKDISTLQAKIKESARLLEYIEGRLATIHIPTHTREELLQKKAEGLEIQRQAEEWNRYVSSTARLQAEIDTLENKINSLEAEISSFTDNTRNIQEGNEKIQQLRSSLINLDTLWLTYNMKEAEIERLRIEGNNAWIEANGIGVGKICSACGQVIQSTAALESHKADLLAKVEEIGPKINALKKELRELSETAAQGTTYNTEIEKQIREIQNTVSTLMAESKHQEAVRGEYSISCNRLESAKRSLASIGVVPEVHLPDRFMEIMSELESEIVAWDIYEKSEQDRIRQKQELDTLETEQQRLNSCMSDLDAYIKLTGPTGVIYEEIMNKLSHQFSDNTVNYVVSRKGKGNKEHLSLNPQYNNNGNWVDYTAASSGQKTILDIAFLTKIVTRLGLLVFDEFLKNLDPENTDLCIEMIKDMNVGCLLLTSHMESIQAFNNRTCNLTLSDSGSSKIEVL